MEALKNNKILIYKMILFFLMSLLMTGNLITLILLNVATFMSVLFLSNKKYRHKVKLWGLVGTMVLFAILLITANGDELIYINLIPAYIILFLSPEGNFFKNDIKKLMIVILSMLTIEILNNSLSTIFGMIIENRGVYTLGFLTNFIIISYLYMIFSYLFKKIGMYIVAGILTISSVINFFVVQWTHQSVTFGDIIKLRTAMSVANKQEFTLKMGILLAISAVLWITVFIVIHSLKKEKRQPVIIIVYRNVIALIMVVVLCLFTNSTFLKFNGGQAYGMITNLIITCEDTFKAPKDKVDYSKYMVKDYEHNNKPNIIIVMSEAFSDLSDSTDKLKLSEDYMPYFKEICSKYPSGKAYSSVYGNNTVTSEAECLTGTSTLFSTQGAELWSKYISDTSWSIVKDLKEQGYETYGIHPSYSYNYNRLDAWQKLGIQNTYFLEDMEKDNKKLEKYRDLVSDNQNYQFIIDKYEENKQSNKPFFCFDVTMQNHAAYKEDLSKYDFDNITSNVTNKETKTEVENYIKLMKKSDDALKTLITYFEKQDEETIILFFGDHQPMFSQDMYSNITGKNASSLSIDKSSDFYKVPFLIWSNKKIKQSDIPKTTSINYLSSLLYKIGNIKRPEIISYDLNLMKNYPVITSNYVITNNKIYSNIDIDEKIKTKDKNNKFYKLKIYQSLTYDIIKGNY